VPQSRVPQTFLIVLGLLMAAPVATAAQAGGHDGLTPGAVVGSVLDASSGEPLAGSVVVLSQDPAGAVTPAASGLGFWSVSRTAVTDAAGTYRFDGLAAGRYRLLVRRIGYRAAMLVVELTAQAALRVSVGLVVEPIRLRAESVEGSRSAFLRSVSVRDELAGARLDAELYRQRRFNTTDARLLTRSDLVEAVTLGEQDLFRAFHRLPGVTTRDDYTAELWTRGASWSHTRVYFDGMPLFNPLHTLGVFSGLDPDAIGSVFFYPGARSASIGEGAAAVLDIGSRRATPGFNGSAGLSVVSGRAAITQGIGSRGGFMLAARRSYVDLLTSMLVDSTSSVPYAFADLTARLDLPLGPTAGIEASGLWERDYVTGTVRDLLRDTRGHWGNGVARLTAMALFGTLVSRTTVGVSRFAGELRTESFRTPSGSALAVPVHEPTDNGLTYLTLGTELEPTDEHWSAGADITTQKQAYFGSPPRPYPQAILLDSLRLADTRHVGSVWGEARLSPGPLSVSAGVRLELAPGVTNVGPLELAPRLSARLSVGERAALSVGYARSFQYTQALAPAGPGVGPDLYLTDVWLLAGDTVPAIRADVATLGGELWLGGGWLGAVNVYGRRATGVAEPDPRPGALGTARPLFAPAVNRAAGIELSARRLIGRWTVALAYSLGMSRMHAAGLDYAAGADRRHVLDATVMVRPRASWRVGAAVTAATGAPFTRILLGPVACDSIVGGCSAGDSLFTTRIIGDPHAQRTGPYLGASVLADWQHSYAHWDIGASLQLHNVFGHRNWITYVGSYDDCVATPPSERDVGGGVCDRFKGGLPLLPVVELRVGF
jgi:hypothetical protein